MLMRAHRHEDDDGEDQRREIRLLAVMICTLAVLMTAIWVLFGAAGY